MPDNAASDDADLVNEPAENTAVSAEDKATGVLTHPEHEGVDDDAEDGLEETEANLEKEGEQLEEKAKDFFHDNPLVVALHNILSGAKTKNPDGSYTITVPDEHVGAAHEVLSDATKT